MLLLQIRKLPLLLLNNGITNSETPMLEMTDPKTLHNMYLAIVGPNLSLTMNIASYYRF